MILDFKAIWGLAGTATNENKKRPVKSMTTNRWRTAFYCLSAAVILGMAAGALMMSRVGLDNVRLLLVLNNTDSDDLMPMYLLKRTDQNIVPLEVTPEGHGIYLTDVNESFIIGRHLRLLKIS